MDGLQEELYVIGRNKTWSAEPRNKHMYVITNRFLLKVKEIVGDNCEVTVNPTSRLVARDFQKIGGAGFGERFPNVVKSTSIPILLASVAGFNLELIQVDVVRAFLRGDINGDVCMEAPGGVTGIGKRNSVCDGGKSLCGSTLSS